MGKLANFSPCAANGSQKSYHKTEKVEILANTLLSIKIAHTLHNINWMVRSLQDMNNGVIF